MITFHANECLVFNYYALRVPSYNSKGGAIAIAF